MALKILDNRHPCKLMQSIHSKAFLDTRYVQFFNPAEYDQERD